MAQPTKSPTPTDTTTTGTTIMSSESHPERKACLAISPRGPHIRHPPSPSTLDPFITDDAHLFQTIHMGPAHVSESLYRLVIAGDVPNPQTLTLSALQSLPSSTSTSTSTASTTTTTTVTAFHECYGPPTAPPTKNHWRVGNVRWTGVPLRDLLALAGVVSPPPPSGDTPTEPDPDPETSLFIHAWGLDSGSFAGHASPEGYTKDIPLSVALDPAAGVLVAWAMNGQPLSRERGWPVRLVVPGWFGTNSVKWLCRLEVRRGRAVGVFTRVLYNRDVDVVDDDGGGGGGGVGGPRPTADDDDGKKAERTRKIVKKKRPVWRVEVNSLITRPGEGDVIRAEGGEDSEGGGEVEVAVEGWAWACEGVAGVQVSADEGASWVECAVDERVEFSWQRFRGRVRLALVKLGAGAGAGSGAGGKGQGQGQGQRRGAMHRLMARARTAGGQTQPLEGRRNHVHRVGIEVV